MKKTLKKMEDAVVASDHLYRAVRKVIQEAQGVVSRVANWTMVEIEAETPSVAGTLRRNNRRI